MTSQRSRSHRSGRVNRVRRGVVLPDSIDSLPLCHGGRMNPSFPVALPPTFVPVEPDEGVHSALHRHTCDESAGLRRMTASANLRLADSKALEIRTIVEAGNARSTTISLLARQWAHSPASSCSRAPCSTPRCRRRGASRRRHLRAPTRVALVALVDVGAPLGTLRRG